MPQRPVIDEHVAVVPIIGNIFCTLDSSHYEEGKCAE
jgi:hypothetical protein